MAPDVGDLDGTWMTPQLREATARFRQAIAEASQSCRATSAAARKASASGIEQTPEYQRLERAAAEHFRSGKAGADARELQVRVDRGELTWRQIREGTSDPEATALYQRTQTALFGELDSLRRRQDERSGPEDDPPDGTILHPAL